MQAKHTPGPWTAALSNDARIDDRVTGAGGAPVLRGSITNTEDAALIAAAPDLLAMLVKLTRAIERLPAASPLDGLAEDARAIIARSTGEA